MACVAGVQCGQVVSVYDDRWQGILSAIGRVQIERASCVEWEDGLWVARRPDGHVIASGRERSEVIAREVSWLEARIIMGREI